MRMNKLDNDPCFFCGRHRRNEIAISSDQDDISDLSAPGETHHLDREKHIDQFLSEFNMRRTLFATYLPFADTTESYLEPF